MSDLGEDTSGLGHIENKMGELQMLMTTEYVKLKEAKEEFAKQKEYYDNLAQKIKSTMPREDERLKLNVSGSRYEIREAIAVKNMFFKTLLSGTFATKDADGFFYIDRDPVFVRVVLNFLRDGTVDLSALTPREMAALRGEAEFYMVPELQSKIDELSSADSSGITTLSFNAQVQSFSHAFNGIFFEVTFKKDVKLHAISFVAGERRRIPCQALYREGPLDGSGDTHRVCEVHQLADRGELVPLTFSTLNFAAGTYTFGLYSTAPNAIACCPRETSRREPNPNVTLGKTYHTTNARGDWGRRAGTDEVDFCGELMLSVN